MLRPESSNPPVTPERSALMARIRGRDTRPELVVRRGLHRLGHRFVLYRRDLPGAPDLVFPSRRVAIFVHGCFWHRHHGCRAATTPTTRSAFWAEKFAANQTRDGRVIVALEAQGWAVHLIWECETQSGAWLGPTLVFLGAHPPRGRNPAGQGSKRTAT